MLNLGTYSPPTEAWTPPSLMGLSPAPVFHLIPLRQRWRLRWKEVSHDVGRAAQGVNDAIKTEDGGAYIDAMRDLVRQQLQALDDRRELFAAHLVRVENVATREGAATRDQVLSWLVTDAADEVSVDLIQHLLGTAEIDETAGKDSAPDSTTSTQPSPG